MADWNSTQSEGSSETDGAGARRAGLQLGPRPRFVQKRDGREVPFDPEKIAQAVARAQSALGETDHAFAQDVATVVELALRRRAGLLGAADGGYLPHIEEVQDLVEEALVELGRAKLAKAYILYRDRRARSREALEVRAPRGPGLEAAPAGLRVREAQRTAPWSKGRITAALVDEVQLPRALAEQVSSRVEARVFASGIQVVSTALIRALVDNELVELGQSEALERHGPLSLGRQDVRRILAGEGAAVFERWARAADPLRGEDEIQDPPGATQLLGGELLRRFALDEVLDERGIALHMDGDVSVEDLCAPHLYLTLAVPVDLVLGGLSHEGGAFALLEGLAGLFGAVSRGLVLEGTGPLLSDLTRATRPGSPLGLAGWLGGLAALSAASGKRVDLLSPGARHGAARLRLLEELAREDRPGRGPRLYMDERECEAILCEGGEAADLLAGLLDQGRAIATWSRGEEQFAAPGCARAPGERGLIACGGAVALNLPRAVRRAGPWREGALMEELAGLVNCALETCRALSAFQQAAAPARPGPMRPRVGYALVPVGLAEALRMFGEGEADPAVGARLLGFLGEAARRFPAPGSPAVRLSPFFGDRAAGRLAWLDSRGAAQGVLFGGAPEVTPQRYSHGFLLSPLGGWRPGEAEAELSRTVGLGALYPPQRSLRSRPAAGSDALRRFVEVSRARRAGREAWLPLEAQGAGAAAPSDSADVLFPAQRTASLDRASKPEPASESAARES